MIKGFVGAGKFRKLLLSPVLLPYQKQLSQLSFRHFILVFLSQIEKSLNWLFKIAVNCKLSFLGTVWIYYPIEH